jgi:hypothetical protein
MSLKTFGAFEQLLLNVSYYDASEENNLTQVLAVNVAGGYFEINYPSSSYLYFFFLILPIVSFLSITIQILSKIHDGELDNPDIHN